MPPLPTEAQKDSVLPDRLFEIIFVICGWWELFPLNQGLPRKKVNIFYLKTD